MIFEKIAELDDDSFKVFLLSYYHPELKLSNLSVLLDMDVNKVYYCLEKINCFLHGLSYREYRKKKRDENKLIKDIRKEMIKQYLKMDNKKDAIKKLFEEYNIPYTRENYLKFWKLAKYYQKKNSKKMSKFSTDMRYNY